MSVSELLAARRARLDAARLYLVCDARPGGRALAEVLPGAIAGGVDVVQLREKDAERERLLPVARQARELCARLGALFVVNDDPLLAREAGADGVHVGQEDMPVAQARALVGLELVVGLSTHAPGEIDVVARLTDAGDPAAPDYIGVGPVHATPTKLGRPAVGLELVRYADHHATVPFFAIGGIDAGNVADVLAAGATRVCVLRAIAQAPEPERAAQELRTALQPHVPAQS